MREPLTPKQKQSIVTLHQQGHRIIDIARQLDRHPNTIGTFLKRGGHLIPSRHTQTLTRARYLELRNTGHSRIQAAKQIGVSLTFATHIENGTTTQKPKDSQDELQAGRFCPAGPHTSRYKQAMHTFTTTPPPDPNSKRKHYIRPISSRYLSITDREKLCDLLRLGYPVTKIASELQVHRSTIYRELERNRDKHGRYMPYHATRLAYARRARPKQSKLVANKQLASVVQDKLSKFWSPQQISAWLKTEFPECLDWHVCHETIYQAIYVQARGGLKRELESYLRQGRARRKPRRQGQARRSRFKVGMLNISERPAEAEDRAVPGHWEGDLILGKDGTSAIGTLVERSTRFVKLVYLPGRHDAESVLVGLVEAVGDLPGHLLKSLTWDQGVEMAAHDRFTIATGCQVYFCDPASPWQRGSNENTNALLRQYFPKGTDLSVHSREELDRVARELNERPRQTLGWKTPAVMFEALLECSQ